MMTFSSEIVRVGWIKIRVIAAIKEVTITVVIVSIVVIAVAAAVVIIVAIVTAIGTIEVICSL